MRPILRDLPIPIVTPRLLIRPPMPGDGAALNQAVLETFEELKEWMPWAQTRPALDDNEEWARLSYAEWITRENLPLLLWCAKTGELVGASGFHHVVWEVPKVEIGYWLRLTRQGEGLMTEAVNALTRYALQVLGARRVEIRCDPRNVKSRAIPERLGYDLEACLKDDFVTADGSGLRDTLIFARHSLDGLPECPVTW